MGALKINENLEFIFTNRLNIGDSVIEGYKELINSEVVDSQNSAQGISGIEFDSQITQEDANQLITKYSSNSNHLLLLSYGDQIIGSGALALRQSPLQKHVGEICKVVVHPHYRRLGFGRIIIENLEKKAEESGLDILLLRVRANLPAVNFYTKLGFETVGVYKNLTKINKQYYDVLSMQKSCKPTGGFIHLNLK